MDKDKIPSPDELTYGELAVDLSFNPSSSGEVHNCKVSFASEIDRMAKLRSRSTGERARLCSVAITEMQTAQMWAVKALTCKE